MKRIFLWFAFLLAGIIVLQAYRPMKRMKKDGAAPGYTGSPGDSLKNCTACHGGNAETAAGWVTSDIPASGYEPGKTYTIRATNKELGATRFGFEVSPQNLKGDLIGKMAIMDSIKTKFVGGNKYITYTENGVEGVDSLSWSFKWTAPQNGTGDLVFYAGFNSNFNGHKAGDKTFLSTLVVKENKSAKLAKNSGPIQSVQIYPNPAQNMMVVRFEALVIGPVQIELVDMLGKQIAIWNTKKAVGKTEAIFNTENYPIGNYNLIIRQNKSSISRNVSIIH